MCEKCGVNMVLPVIYRVRMGIFEGTSACLQALVVVESPGAEGQRLYPREADFDSRRQAS